MYNLGISCYYHDSAAALLKDGHVIAAVEEERFSRKKFDDDFPSSAINWCLEEAKIAPNELHSIAESLLEDETISGERMIGIIKNVIKNNDSPLK